VVVGSPHPVPETCWDLLAAATGRPWVLRGRDPWLSCRFGLTVSHS